MLTDALIYLAAAVIAVPLFKRFGLGAVLGYLVAGVVIGPAALKLVNNAQSVLHFAEFGVVLLLFLVGLELNPKKLWALRLSIFGTGTVQVIVTAGVVLLLGQLLGVDWRISMVAGIAFAMSSTAIALASLTERNLMSTEGGRAGFSVLLFQDIAVIPAFLVLAAIAPAKGEGALDTLGILKAVGLIFSFVLIGRFLIRPVLRYIANTGLKEVFIAFALLLVLGAAVAAQAVGLSMALGTFLAGVLLADSEYRHELELDIEPFKGLLLGLFFIAVGMSVDLNLFVTQPVLVFGMASAVVAGKLVLLLAIARLFKLCGQDAAVFAVALSQIGEFAFVLIATALNQGTLSHSQANLMNAVVAASMLSTPFLFIALTRWVMPRLNRMPTRSADAIEEKNEIIVAGFGRFGQVVARLLIARGFGVTLIDNNPNQVDFIRKFGFKAYYGDVSRLEVLEAAGIENTKLLVLATDDAEATLETAKLVKEKYPEVKILARARGRTDGYALEEINIPFERETFRAAAAAGQKALLMLGESPHQAHRAVQTFIRHDERLLKEGAAHREDVKKLIDLAHKARQDLALILTRERTNAKSNSQQPADW
ncbi:MAG: monovalent cation:proton antiporter-2 (CPA2) family protein [Burkholderiaceae bacterium]|nr:monovalent cation:proton antiporter-2 (CPA2) family protein [Burkholderiaceae bacterium]